MRRCCWAFFALLLNTGCATHYLWTGTAASAFCEPAPDPELHIYADAKGRNVLVLYNEINEHNDRIIRRGYFVLRNAHPVSSSRRPLFVEPESALTLHPIPVRIWTNSLSTYIPQGDDKESGWFAAAIVSQQRFSLFENRQPRGTYELPVYEDGTALARRLFLTPWTVALDVTVIGGILYLQAGAPGLAN
jgi:hypothetical protein